MTKELRIRGYSNKTIKAYTGHMERFALRYGKDVSCASEKVIKDYLLELIDKYKYEYSSIAQVVCAIKFYFAKILDMENIISDIPFPRKEKKLPDVLSQNEVADILKQTVNLKHKTILFFVYAAGL